MREPSDNPDPPQKNQAAAELGRRGGMKGGVARAARMSPEERADAARLAAQARWARNRAEGDASAEDDRGLTVFTLTPGEAAYIIETTVVGRGGLQTFQRQLQKQLATGNTVALDVVSLGRLVRYIEKYGSGGFQHRLQQAFGRSLRAMLGI
jgi:hypothetical protein